MSFGNIPAELKALHQWVCWKLVSREGMKPTKLPVNPLTGDLADVTKPETWCSFEMAVEASVKYSGIGFVFSSNDPYCGIDLDDTHGDAEAYARQIKVFQEFASYSELSPSGNGLHIIIKAKLPGLGRRRAGIEIYDSNRYFTFTGNVHLAAPIQERQELAETLYEQMGGPAAIVSYGVDEKETQTDEQIIEIASSAVNGDKFKALFAGQWSTFDYPSQSEADFALVDIIAFYTKNRAQIYRIYAESALGKAPKDNYKHRSDRVGYVSYMVEKSFDRQLPPVDAEGLKIAWDKLQTKQDGEAGKLSRKPASPNDAGDTTEVDPPSAIATQGISGGANLSSLPPGLVGEIAKFIYDKAARQVETIALVGAIGLLAGITGRAYNVGDSGLNQYILLIAETGRGKEGIASGISKLMAAVQTSVPGASEFVGPTQIASPQGLSRWFLTAPCFYSIAGEFGVLLKQMSDPKAPPHLAGLRRSLLDLYHKSGKSDVWGASAHAKKEDGLVVVKSPAITLIGESNPLRFYENLNEGVVNDGLLPRFTIFNYEGDQVPLNENRDFVEPSFALVQKLSEICAHVLSLQSLGQVQKVGTTPDANKLLKDFEEYARNLVNNCDPKTGKKRSSKPNSVVTELWNRAHIKAIRLAAVIAVGVDYINPTITVDIAQWATDQIFEQVENLKGRFDRGEIGGGSVDALASEDKQMEAMIGIISGFAKRKGGPDGQAAYLKKSKITEAMFNDMVFPFNNLLQRLQIYGQFRNDRRGASEAIRRAYQILIDNDDIRELPKQQVFEKYGKKCRAFMISNPEKFILEED